MWGLKRHTLPAHTQPAIPPSDSSALVPSAPLPRSGAKAARSRSGVPTGNGGRAGPARSRALGPGCKLGAFSASFGSPGWSWKLVTTLLCKGAWKQGRAEETGAGRRKGGRGAALPPASIRGGHGQDGGSRRQSLRGGTPPLPRCARVLHGDLEPFPFVRAPDLEAKGRGPAAGAVGVPKSRLLAQAGPPAHRPLPKSLTLPVQGCGTAGGGRKGN